MGINSGAADTTENAGAESQGSGKPTGFDKIKNSIADTLHNVANTLGEKTSNQDAQPGIAQYGKQASVWLDQSAEYVRQFDHEQTNARVREYVRQSPGRSLLIAGGVGLFIGIILRRR